MKEYKCSKCGGVVHTNVPLEYCVCGGRYKDQSLKDIPGISLGGVIDVFNDMFGKGDK